MSAVPGVGRADGGAAALTHDLYTRFGVQIHAYCKSRLRTREEAEDAVQTTFMNVFRALQGGTRPEVEQAWLYRIAQHVCAQRATSAGKRLRLEAPNDFEVLQEVVAAPAADGADRLIGLDEVLAGMPENQRRAILLREWQGLSYREISEELGLTQTAVEMLIFRARRALAKGLEEQAAEPKVAKARRGLLQGLDLGAVAGAIKSFLTGGAAVKAVVLAVAAGTATGALSQAAQKTIVRHSRQSSPAGIVPAPSASSRATTRPAAATGDVPLPLLPPVHHAALARQVAAPRVLLPAADPTPAVVERPTVSTLPTPTPAPPAAQQPAAPSAPAAAVTPSAPASAPAPAPAAAPDPPPARSSSSSPAPASAPSTQAPPAPSSEPEDQQPAATTPTAPPAAPAKDGHGNGQGDDGKSDKPPKNDNRGGEQGNGTQPGPPPPQPVAPPVQAKAAPAAPVQVQAPAPAAIPSPGDNGRGDGNGHGTSNGNGPGNGNGDGNGNGRGQDKGRPDPPPAPVAPQPVAPPVQTAPAPAAPTDSGSGNGQGNGRGDGPGNGHGRGPKG